MWNVRYLAPAVALGLAILPCLPALRATPRRQAAVLAALAVLLAFTVGSLVQWQQGHTKGAVAAALLVVAGAAVASVLRLRGLLGPASRMRVRIALAAVVVAVVVAAGYREQDHYLTHRYQNTGQVQDLSEALRWSRDVRDARIAVGGIRGCLHPVPLLRHRPLQPGAVAGDSRPPRLLPAHPRLRRVAAGGQRRGYTQWSPPSTPTCPTAMRNSPEGRWTESDPAATRGSW